MKQIVIGIAAAAVTLAGSAAYAAPGHTKSASKPAAPKKAAAAIVCPVTGTKIASAAKAYNKEVYKGKTYYFCCPECKPRFDKNRDQILKNAAQGKYEKM